jgi:hypothetical protein
VSAGPDIAQLLASMGGGGNQPSGPQQGQPQQGPDQSSGQPVDILKQIVGLIQQYLQAEPDEEDKLQGAKLFQLAQQLLAKDQQDHDQAMGGSSQRILRKAG